MIEDFQGRKVAVIGMARSGMAAAQVLTQRGARVTLCDNGPESELVAQISQAKEWGIDVATGSEIAPDGTELLVTSPGVRKSASVLVDAEARGIEIWSEIEAAYQISAAPIIAVTGTNGKTTTVALLGEIGKAAGYKTYVAGNIAAGEIALPLIRACHEAKADDLIVAEISSFQLEWIKEFRPKVAVITNITVDHSDRQTWGEYVAAKWRIFENQRAGDTSVLRSDVPKPPLRPNNGGPQKSPLLVTQGQESPHYWGFRGQTVVIFDHLQRPSWLNILLIPGEHNRENAMAALAAARAFGIDDQTIQRASLAFTGVVHRLEFVRKDAHEVTWINNSMCTNNDAFARSLDAIPSPKIVLAGGVYKGGDPSQFGRATAGESVKALIFFGKSGEFLADVARDHGAKSVQVVETLSDAVHAAESIAAPSDTVLLSPACASFDQFKDFEDRGDQFKEMVQ